MAGIKDVENRTWPTKYRGLLVVHAGQRRDKSEWADLFDVLPSGVALGTVELVGCVLGSSSEWAEESSWHWQLADPRPYPTPVPMTGRLGLWSIAA